MSAEMITFALLSAHAPLTNLVADRVYPGIAPQGKPLPLVVTNLISSLRRNTLSTAEAKQLIRARMQVTVFADSYAGQKRLIELCADACKYRRGAIAGFSGVSVLPDLTGPDMRDDAARIYMQTQDFMVAYQST